jgi:hypothetical protein
MTITKACARAAYLTLLSEWLVRFAMAVAWASVRNWLADMMQRRMILASASEAGPIGIVSSEVYFE